MPKKASRSKKAVWCWVPPKPEPPKVPLAEKADILEKAEEFVRTVMSRTHIAPRKEDPLRNYVSELRVKWSRHYVLFSEVWQTPGPNAISPSYERNFIRLTYVAEGKFDLFGRRYNDQWIVLKEGLNLEECFVQISTHDWFRVY